MIEALPDQSNFQALMDEAALEQDALCLETLARIEGVGRQTLARLLQKAGSPQALWEVNEAFLREHLPDKKREAFLRMQDAGLNFPLLERIKQKRVRLLACTHPAYPSLLREIHSPPAFLYVKGDFSALSGRTVAVVGTRKASEYGRQVTDKLVGELQAAGITIVSGLAAGIDTMAHWAALRNSLPTVAVFGCGLDVVFPSSNRKLSEEIVARGGALVSEYPLGMAPTQYTFPQRNRIVAGLCHGLLVVEGDLKSGALITARLALEEGRTVFAVPGNIFSAGHQGPMSLLRNGAVPVDCGEHILQELQWWQGDKGQSQATVPTAQGEKPASHAENVAQRSVTQLHIPEGLEPQERMVLQAIGHDPVSVDDLQQTTGLPSAKINGSLTLLELDGLIVLLPGAKVCRKSIC
jgi:DNA processing protein